MDNEVAPFWIEFTSYYVLVPFLRYCSSSKTRPVVEMKCFVARNGKQRNKKMLVFVLLQERGGIAIQNGNGLLRLLSILCHDNPYFGFVCLNT